MSGFLRKSIAFGSCFTLFLLLGGVYGQAQSAQASQASSPVQQVTGYAGPEACAPCHQDIHQEWQVTRHAQAFSSPIFQQNWEEIGSEFTCLSCHTTGYDPATNDYAFEGVTCEACHGPFQGDHPNVPMPIKADHELCSTCHKTTTDEWQSSVHGQADIQCQSCHDPHAQRPKAENVTALCSNCHKERGSSYTHGTHADAGLECSNCHMFTDPRFSAPIEGLVPTGHTFAVGSLACVGCHQDTVHTRNTILELSGQVSTFAELDLDQLQMQVQEQAEQISNLEASSTTRLYVGLAQGGIVGLATGAVAAWVVSRNLKEIVIEGSEDDEEDQA